MRRRQSDRNATWVLSQEELMRRFDELPEADFPITRRYARELTSRTGHERFGFTLGLLIDNLVELPPKVAVFIK